MSLSRFDLPYLFPALFNSVRANRELLDRLEDMSPAQLELDFEKRVFSPLALDHVESRNRRVDG